MQWLFRPLMTLWTGLFGDKRSEYEKQRERSFIEAVNKLKNYYVTDRGGLFMDPEEVRRVAVTQFLEEQRAAEARTNQESVPLAVSTMDCIQIITWRRLSSQTATRYVCLQSLDGIRFCVAMADFFSGEADLFQSQSFDRRLAERLITSESGAPLEWFSSLKAAMDAWDESL